jgi:hypothetical protein
MFFNDVRISYFYFDPLVIAYVTEAHCIPLTKRETRDIEIRIPT